MPVSYPLVTLEDHFVATAVNDFYASKSVPYMKSYPGPVLENLLDLNTTRLSAMDAAGITLQIISHAPNNIPIPASICTQANDQLHSAIKSHPTRFAGLALLPMDDISAATAELTRCVKELGFLGSLIDNTTESHFYDDPAYHPLFEAHVSLNVPLYLHPSLNPSSLPILYSSTAYPTPVSFFLAGNGMGWHSECAIHILRLFCAGIFDKFPKLKLIVGHMGEMLPFQLDRIDKFVKRYFHHWECMPRRGLWEVWDENVWVTTSGMFSTAPMSTVLRTTRVERVLFSVDWPFVENELGAEFMEEMEKEVEMKMWVKKENGAAGSGNVRKLEQDDMKKVAYGNAQELFGIKVQRE